MECKPSTSSDFKTESVVNSQQTADSSSLEIDNPERKKRHSTTDVEPFEEEPPEKKLHLP